MQTRREHKAAQNPEGSAPERSGASTPPGASEMTYEPVTPFGAVE